MYEVMDHPVQMSVRGAKQAGNLPDMVGFQLHPKGRIGSRRHGGHKIAGKPVLDGCQQIDAGSGCARLKLVAQVIQQGGCKAGVCHFMRLNIVKGQPDEQAFLNGFDLRLDWNASNEFNIPNNGKRMTEAKKKRFAGFDAGGHLNLPLHKEQKGIHGEAFMQDDLARLELPQCKGTGLLRSSMLSN